MISLTDLLIELDACPEAQKWAKDYTTYKSAWEACDRSDWLLYILEKLNYDPIQLRLIGAWCARNTPLGDGRTTWDLLTDKQSRHAIKVAENPASTKEELVAAFSVASFAASYAASFAAYTAAYFAAFSAAYFAARYAAYSAAHFAAYYAAGKAQADHIKSVVKLDDVIKLIRKGVPND